MRYKFSRWWWQWRWRLDTKQRWIAGLQWTEILQVKSFRQRVSSSPLSNNTKWWIQSCIVDSVIGACLVCRWFEETFWLDSTLSRSASIKARSLSLMTDEEALRADAGCCSFSGRAIRDPTTAACMHSSLINTFHLLLSPLTFPSAPNQYMPATARHTPMHMTTAKWSCTVSQNVLTIYAGIPRGFATLSVSNNFCKIRVADSSLRLYFTRNRFFIHSSFVSLIRRSFSTYYVGEYRLIIIIIIKRILL